MLMMMIIRMGNEDNGDSNNDCENENEFKKRQTKIWIILMTRTTFRDEVAGMLLMTAVAV